MAYTYKGTKITGTSTTAKTFEHSGISKAGKKDTYFNTDIGHVYVCTEGSKAKDAKWKYKKTDIAKKPNKTVSKLATPSRSGYKLNATWVVPSPLTNVKSGSRAEEISTKWTVSTTKDKKKKEYKFSSDDGTGHTSSSFNLDNFKYGKTSFDRDSFWPVTQRTVNSVTIAVAATNSKGTGKWVSKTYGFEKPRSPKFGAWSFDTATGDLTITITTNAGTDKRERYDTYYKVTYWDSRQKDSKGKIIKQLYDEGSTKSTSKTISFDSIAYQALSDNDYIKVEVEAWSRGLRGNSSHVKSTPFYISYPKKVTITKVECSSKSSTGKCTVYIDAHKVKTEAHPIDMVKLEYLANSPYSKANQIPGDAGWEASEITDDGNSSALAISVANLLPDRGKYTWLRVKSWHANEAVLYKYSNYKLSGMEEAAPSAADDEIVILSASAGTDGKSIVVHLGWNADGQDDSTGTELTWSDAEDTWKSTDEPDNHMFTWSDGETYGLTTDTAINPEKTYYTRSGSGTEEDPYVYTEVVSPDVAYIDTYYEKYLDGATIIIKGLDEGTGYYVRARRYLEDEDTTTYSGYSNQVSAFTSETPEAITATCEPFVPHGASLPIYWTFAGNGVQTAWQILTNNSTITGTDYVYTLTTDALELTDNKTYYTRTGAGTEQDPYVYTEVADPDPDNLATYYERSSTDGEMIAQGEGAAGTAKLDADVLQRFAYEGNLAFVVRARTGSEWVTSDVILVSVIDPPELSVTVNPVLTVNALTFNATVTRLCDLRVIVTSLGVTGQFPQGVMNQVLGDTIHSDIYQPAWVESGSVFVGTVELPPGLDFWDNGQYSLSVVAIDRETGLQSEDITTTITVAWANQAVSPKSIEAYTLTEDTEVDETKTYYEYNVEEAVYETVVPDGDEDPLEEGWYERSVTDYVTLTPIDTVSDNGEHLQGVQIDLTPPAGSSETDLYDIYRMTGDGPRLIGEDFPLTYSGIDEFAPFGEDMTHEYRIALKTTDGDVEFADFEYVLDCAFMRFDWRTGSLELPYNISIGDKYSKSVDIRNHMDGNNDGYWNQNIERKASLNSDVIRLTMQDEIDSARSLARYTGAVFVRTPDGNAYEADVQVSDMSTEGVLTAIAIDTTEIGLTQEFVLPTPYTHEEEES